jgi:hypothetical protein
MDLYLWYLAEAKEFNHRKIYFGDGYGNGFGNSFGYGYGNGYKY